MGKTQSETISDEIVKWIDNAVEAHAQEACTVSDAIWDTPELGGLEEKSSRTLIEALSAAGFKITAPAGGIPTAFTAAYGSGKPVIGLLAEYDALTGLSQVSEALSPQPIVPGGNGHGCGHNLLGAGCYAAALALKDYIDKFHPEGTVVVFGCPAEEKGSGKTFMARAGVFGQVDIALSWHPNDWTGIVPTNLQADAWVRYSFTGQASHAAVAPQLGRSALDAVELMDVGANYLREHVSSDVKFHYAVTNTGGTSPNVVQSEAEAVYLIRAASQETVKNVKERIDNIARGAALMTETQASIEFITACSAYDGNTVAGNAVYRSMTALGAPKFSEADKKIADAYAATLKKKGPTTALPFISMMIKNDPSLSYLETASLNDVIIPYRPLPICSAGTSDVGDVSQTCPTIMFLVTTCAQGTPGHSWQMVAQGKSSLAHTGMLYGAKVMALTAISFWSNPQLAEEAWAEYRLAHADKPYACPIPEEITFSAEKETV